MSDKEGWESEAVEVVESGSGDASGTARDDPLSEEDRKAFDSFVAELSGRIAEKLAMRKRNLEADTNRPDENFLRKLDSSLKKNTAFIKKLKNLTEAQRAGLVKDFGALNLTKFVAEIASSVVEVKLKMTDVASVVEICSLAHQRYAEFSPSLMENWKKVFPTKKNADRAFNSSKLRVDLRLYAELISAGVFNAKEGLSLLGAVLMYLVAVDKESGEHHNLPTLTAFTKFCGFEYAGCTSRKFQTLSKQIGVELPQNPEFIPPEKQKNVRKLLRDYYGNISERLQRDHSEIKAMQRRNQIQYLTKGEVYEDAAKRLEEKKAAFETLLKNATTFADFIDEETPCFPQDDPDDDLLGDQGMSIQMGSTFGRGDGAEGGLWEDEDTRQFYETLPELKAILPGILFKESEKATLEPLEEKIEEETRELVEEEAAAEGVGTSPLEEEIAVEQMEEEGEEVEEDGEEGEEEEKTVSGGTLKLLMEAFVNQLSTFVNRDMIDNAATDFVTNLNTKTNRKKLVRALFEVQRTRLDLLPFYSRFVAVLHPVMPDVGTGLVMNLKNEFRRLHRKKDQIKVESKIKNIRFIGELVKFKIYPKSEALHCFKMLLFDFRHHAIDMACAFLETAGYFLLHSPDSHQKTKLLLEQMMRKRQAVALDGRYQLMVDNAYYYCNPPPTGAGPQRKERPPLHEYVRKLLFKDLSRSTAARILKQLRKLDWADTNVAAYTVKCLSSPWLVKYSCIQYLASILAGLMAIYEWVGYDVVDNLLEDVRLGMEVNDSKFNQRRISALKYIGEMYNYRVVDSGIIFSLLYSLITFGSTPDSGCNTLDPPEHLLRIRLVCILLETCGYFFEKGSAGKKLDCFLTYFQRYYLRKKSLELWNPMERRFPLEVDNLMTDLRDKLRPKLKLFEKLEDADAGVKEIEEQYREKVELMLKFRGTEGEEGGYGEEEEEEEDGLAPIEEGEEEGDAEGEGRGSQSQHLSQGTGGRSSAETPIDSEGVVDEEEEEEVVHVNRAGLNEGGGAEDAEFLEEFERMMAEEVAERMKGGVKAPEVQISVPTKIKMGVKFDEVKEDVQVEEKEEDFERDFEGETKTRRFQVLVKKGNKMSTKPISIPVTAAFVQALEDKEEADKREKELMKKHTLNQAARIEQEELAEEQRAIRNVFGGGEQRKRKTQQQSFQPQKGAPMPNQLYDNWS